MEDGSGSFAATASPAAGVVISTSSSEQQQKEEEEENSELQLQQELERFSNNFDLLDNAVADLNVDQNTLDVYVSWLNWIQSGNGTEMHVDLCYDEFLPRTIKLLLNTRNVYTVQRARMMNRFLLELCRFAVMRMRILLNTRELPGTLADCMLAMCNPCSPFYLTHLSYSHEEEDEEKREVSKEAQSHLTEQETNELSVGSLVFLLQDGGNDKMIQGEIIEISPTDTEVNVMLTVGGSRWVSKDPTSFYRSAEGKDHGEEDAESRPDHPRFRSELCSGFLCDAKAVAEDDDDDGENAKRWYQACVVSVKHGKAEEDLIRVHLLGFPVDKDIVVARSSRLLAPLNMYSHGRRGRMKVCPSLVEDDNVEASYLFGDFVDNKPSNLPIRARKSKPSCSFYISNINAVFPDLIYLIQRNVNVNLRLAIMCLSHLLPYMAEEVTVHMASTFPMLVLRAIEQLTTQQIRNSITKALINRTASVCHRLVIKSRYNDDKSNIVERIRMEFCRKLLESEMIMKRVDGLQLLNELIRVIRACPQGVYLNSLGYYSMHVKSNVQPKLFATWCQSQHFLASFFSPPNRAHSELVKRSSSLVTMLCEETLQFEDFDLIWQTACTSDDEEISSASFALLGECSHCFPAHVKQEFKHKLMSVEHATARQIDLFRDLVQVSPDLADVAVNALWKEAMREEDSEGGDVACAALEQALKQEHNGAEWESQVRLRALERCCGMLANPKALRILRSAVESFPIAGNRSKLVDCLCNEKHVLTAMLDTFEDCTLHAQFRLDCVAFILRNRSSKMLEFATIDTLLAHFTRGNMEHVLYNWLQKIARATYSKKQQDEVVLSPEAMQLLFARIQQDDFTSAFAFRVFQATFLGVNLINGKIRHTDTDFTLVDNEPLLGEKTLWSAALGPKSSDVVSESAAHYISFLQQRVPAEMRWERLAAKFQQVLAVMQQQQPNAGLARCCTLLQYLLIDNESEFASLVRADFHNTELWEKIRPHSTLGPYAAACWVNVNNNIKNSVGNGKPFRIRIRANDAVGKARGLIFETVGMDVCTNAEDIRLFAGGGEIHLKTDAKSLIAVAPHAPHFVACKRMAPLATQQQQQQQQPAFEQWLDPISLFLLDSLATYEGEERPRWVDKAVRLLDLLPTSRAMVDEVLQVQYAAEFDRNAFRTTYLLEILQDEMHRLQTLSEDLESLAKPYFPRLQDLLVSDKLAGKAKPLRIAVSLLYHLLSACCATAITTMEQNQASTSAWPQSKFSPFTDDTKSILLSQIDFTALQDAIVCRMVPLALEATGQEDSELISTCFALWSQLLVLDTNALFDTCNAHGLEQIIAKCDSNVSQGMVSLCDLLSYEQCTAVFNACLRALPSENEALLNLAEHLLQRSSSSDVGKEAIKILLTKVQQLPRKEQFPPSRVEPYYNEADASLVGLLRLITQAVSTTKLEEDELAQFDCIALCVLGGEECRCQSAQSRNTAYQCLLQICNALPGAGDAWFSRWFHSAFDASRFYSLETTPPDLDLKSPYGFCGIINLGATCYMNSLFQQLWAIPAVRHGLRTLDMQPNAEDDDVELVMLLQSFFQELSHSTHRTCTLEPFAAKFKDELGARLNVLEQQDAQEIFERVCDRLDDCMHRQNKPRLFRIALGVKIASKFVCLEDETKPTREDQGSLEWCLKVHLVPGCSKLEEILDKFVAGEVLQRFTWEDSGPSLRTLKKQVIKSLGNTLVIHLARFHMNWDTQVCEKSNDRLEFPLELDMLPYCDVGDSITNKEEYKYRLVGVLVHDGARLNSGHYYSYCESRIVGSSTFGKWYCFNDASVDEFDLSADLEEAAFGGMNKTNGNATTMRTHGAYMLFYERVSCQAVEEQPVAGVPEAVARQNHDHLLACRLFDPALLQFLTARCVGNDRLSGSQAAAATTTLVMPREAKKQRTDSEALLDIVSSRFLVGDAIAARCGGLPAGVYYCPLAESLTRSLECSPVRSSAFVNSLQPTDYRLLLVDVGGYRIGVSFAMLLCVAFQTSRNTQAMSTLLSFPVVDHVLQNPQVDNSYWFALKLIMECCNDLDKNDSEESTAFAQAAFSFHLLPIVFNAVLGVASPAHQYELVPPGNVLQKRPIPLAHNQRVAPSSSSPAVSSWDHAIAACVACARGMLARTNSTDEHEQRIDELASWLCLSDVRSWANLITHLDSDNVGVLDSFVALFYDMLNANQTSAVGLAAVLAKVASTSSLDAILRIYDLVNKLAVACASQQIAPVFFLGEDGEHQGLFSLLVGNRSNRFAFFCIAAFVERVVEEAQFLEMLTLGRLDQWASNVDEFLRNDALANTLEPHELNRMIRCLELVNGLSATMGSSGGALPPQDLVQNSNLLVSATSDNTLFDYNDNECDVGSSSMEGGSINSDAVSSMLDDEDEEEEDVA